MKHVTSGLAIVLGGFLGLSQTAQAQGNYADDALLFSRTGPSGTARVLGLGGASTALGGDFSNLSVNPAGLGLFTKSEFTFSPGVGVGSTTATPLLNNASAGGGSLDQAANSFHVASVGIVFANRRADNDQSSDWRGGAFSFGFTRQADFNQATRYQNQTTDKYSFFQFLREPGGYSNPNTSGYQGATANILAQDNAFEYTNLDGLAYGNFLTDIVNTKRGNLDSVVTNQNPAIRQRRAGGVQQNELLTTKGSLSQFDLGYGGNYRDRLYIGGAVGIVSLSRTRNSTFSEASGGIEDFRYEDYLRTTGTGINARIGLIYRLVDAVRLGASIQTPTYIHLTDEYSTTLTVNPAYLAGTGVTQNVLTTQPGTYEYGITTPFRANGGLVVLLSKYGFLTGDVEYVGYSQARFSLDNDDGTLSSANALVKQYYKNTVNLRAGIEGRFAALRVRLGFAHYGDPYAQSSFDRSQNYFTGGLGYRGSKFFVDGSAVYTTVKDQYSPYTLATTVSPLINLDTHRTTVTVTGGVLF